MGASAAMAGPLVQGGGSSLVAPTIGTVPSTANEIGLFGISEATLTYYSVGSGAGQNAFLGNQPTFLAPGLGGTVDFANSDAALTPTQVSGYTSSTIGAASGPLIQIPYIVTPITIPLVNGPAVTSTTTPKTSQNNAHSVALNDDDLCGIFSGNFTNWSQVTNPETGAKYPASAGAIKVVYRIDSSGTSELLTRHLANVCKTSGSVKMGVTFVDSLLFTDSFPSGIPTTFVGASGSAGIRSVLTSATTNALVAYLSPDYTNAFLAPKSTVVLPTSTQAQLSLASLLNAVSGKYVAPTAADASAAIATITAPTGTTLTDPAGNPLNWVPTSGTSYDALAKPVTGYPISGTSQIVLSQCYKDATVGQAVHDFLNDHYNNTTFISVVQGNGFDVVPTGFQNAITTDFLTAARGTTLNINNSATCGTKGR
jgi:ABC-type phosphate transport system substrate-binding protein